MTTDFSEGSRCHVHSGEKLLEQQTWHGFVEKTQLRDQMAYAWSPPPSLATGLFVGQKGCMGSAPKGVWQSEHRNSAILTAAVACFCDTMWVLIWSRKVPGDGRVTGARVENSHWEWDPGPFYFWCQRKGGEARGGMWVRYTQHRGEDERSCSMMAFQDGQVLRHPLMPWIGGSGSLGAEGIVMWVAVSMSPVNLFPAGVRTLSFSYFVFHMKPSLKGSRKSRSSAIRKGFSNYLPCM